MSFEQFAMGLREEALLKVLRKNNPELVTKYEKMCIRDRSTRF